MKPYFSRCEYDNYQPHFLDFCSLCHKSLSLKSDIFMYRGNTPFCSLDCRQEQIEIDEAREKRWRVGSSSSSSYSSVKRSIRQTSESPNQSETKKAVRTGVVAVA